jgi:hypothetical protein
MGGQDMNDDLNSSLDYLWEMLTDKGLYMEANIVALAQNRIEELEARAYIHVSALPEMAGTGREHEQERLAIIMDWMWSVVLPQLQQIADSKGFGDAWKNMCQLKTADAAKAANNAYAVADSAATYAASSADAAARAVYDVGSTKQKVATVCAATLAARAAAAAAEALDDPDFWETVDPIGVLERMTYLNMETTQ